MTPVKKKAIAQRKNAQPARFVREVSSGETSSSSDDPVAQSNQLAEGPTAEHGGAMEGYQPEEQSEEDAKVRAFFFSSRKEVPALKNGCDDQF